MSVLWWGPIWKEGPPDPIERYVLLALADNADAEGIAFPSLAAIVSKTRLSESTVRRSIARLEAGGWLQVEPGNGRGKRSQYRLKRVSERDPLAKETNVTLTETECQADGERASARRRKGVTVTEPPHPLKGVTVKEPSENRKGGNRHALMRRGPDSPQSPIVSAKSDAANAAKVLFEELEVPADYWTCCLAEQGILYLARELGGIPQAAESILKAAQEAKASGETRWRFWFEDSKYRSNSAT